ncbi:hypothetical protein N7495_008418 [Penicillium taxi]|uniref:uncharacterized protein n=1 Tax=Penicillium taxi TaxID=168475 RepID=UPI002544E1D1|nr:uncharacterized protein N7495_008418 [Penicillium taxi]KAJ5888377.1 hypothetical protein N7495_008418 [Penicillium taxi]
MNGHSGAMSPVSVSGSDWSGINQYQKPNEPPFSPTFPSRGNLSTPPNAGVPVPLSPNSTSPLVTSNPSPPSSVAARSSVGTAPGDKERDGGRRRRQMEEILGQHYVALKRFLSATYREDRANGRSNKARDKLLRLSPTQFHELSTDVYDELVRRQQANPPPGRPPRPDIPSFLPARTDFHEKRNHARSKLASLQHQRFRDLATDVFCELERRFPHFTRGRPPPNMPPGSRSSQRGPGARPPGSAGFPPRQGSLGPPSPGMNGDGPLPRSFQSNTMIPNKSTMVEDSDDMGDDDDDARSDAFALDAVLSRRGTTTTLGDSERKLLLESQTQVSSLLEQVEKLEELVRSKDEELARSRDLDQSGVSHSERQEWDDLRADLESKVIKAEDLNSSLQLELERVRAEHEHMERQVSGGSEDEELTSRYADLESKHQSLQEELQQQREVTAQVRQETSKFLMEMKTLTAQSHSNYEREEKLANDVHRLENELHDWKNRYAKAKSQLRHLRTSSGGISDNQPDASFVTKEHELVQHDGVVSDIHVTKFQMSIDGLLRVARFEDPSEVMQQIKVVIMAVRHIIQDVDQAPPPVDGTAVLRTKSKGRVSATANNIITASRNYATSGGLSPVSLLDAAASHLCTAVVELVRVVKIQASPADDLDDENVDVELSQEKFPDYLSTTASQRPYSNHSEYSAMSAPDHPSMQNGFTNGFDYGAPQEDHEIQELKFYVEDQTDGMVQNIQSLVASIRADQSLSIVETHLSAIDNVVAKVVSAIEQLAHERSGDVTLRERCEPIIQTLDECRSRLMNTAAEGHETGSPEQLREVINHLPPIAFEIARQTKELVSRLESLALGEDDDFR